MDYKREIIKNEIDTIFLTPEEFEAANKIFLQSLHTKYPTLDTSNIKYNTVVMTDGLYRTEYKVKVLGE